MALYKETVADPCAKPTQITQFLKVSRNLFISLSLMLHQQMLQVAVVTVMLA